MPFEAKSRRRSLSFSWRVSFLRLLRDPIEPIGVSLAGDVIFRELSVNPLFSFPHATVLSLSHRRAPSPSLSSCTFPLIRSEGRFPGSCPTFSTSDVAAFESADKLVSPCTYRISDIKFVRLGDRIDRAGHSMNTRRRNRRDQFCHHLDSFSQIARKLF